MLHTRIISFTINIFGLGGIITKCFAAYFFCFSSSIELVYTTALELLLFAIVEIDLFYSICQTLGCLLFFLLLLFLILLYSVKFSFNALAVLSWLFYNCYLLVFVTSIREIFSSGFFCGFTNSENN